MRGPTVSVTSLIVALAVLLAPRGAAASESATATVTVTANFASRTSLKVSTELLQFEIGAPPGEAIAVVEFAAGARTHHGGEVVLTVEPMRATEGPGGAADVETSVRFAGEGEGTLSGALHPMSPTLAGRWIGSGRRTGRLTFALRARVAGSYRLPVRFVLSTP
jgi:hypothetical protein